MHFSSLKTTTVHERHLHVHMQLLPIQVGKRGNICLCLQVWLSECDPLDTPVAIKVVNLNVAPEGQVQNHPVAPMGEHASTCPTLALQAGCLLCNSNAI